MVSVSSYHHPETGLLRFADRYLHRQVTGELSGDFMGIDYRRNRCLPNDLDLTVNLDPPLFNQAEIKVQSLDAMQLDPPQVRFQDDLSDNFTVFPGVTGLPKDVFGDTSNFLIFNP
jgi:hypothetical protein